MTTEQSPSLGVHPFQYADSTLASGVETGVFTHAAYGVLVDGTVAAKGAFGAADEDTIFDLASLTKPLATATAVLQLVEQGKMDFNQSIAGFFEDEFGSLPNLAKIEVRHLLTHTSGWPAIPHRLPSLDRPDRKTLIATVLDTPVLYPPGAAYLYSDTGYIALGEIATRVAGVTQAELFQVGVAQPLSLQQTGYLPPDAWKTHIAPTGADIPIGLPHDPRARELGGVCGHAGLFGTVSDLMVFAEAIRNGGFPILSRTSAAKMGVSQIASSIGAHSFGWFCAGNAYLPKGDLFSDHSFGHSGFTGTAMLIDPANTISLVLLTNRVINESEDGTRFLQLRKQWLNAMAVLTSSSKQRTRLSEIG